MIITVVSFKLSFQQNLHLSSQVFWAEMPDVNVSFIPVLKPHLLNKFCSPNLSSGCVEVDKNLNANSPLEGSSSLLSIIEV